MCELLVATSRAGALIQSVTSPNWAKLIGPITSTPLNCLSNHHTQKRNDRSSNELFRTASMVNSLKWLGLHDFVTGRLTTNIGKVLHLHWAAELRSHLRNVHLPECEPESLLALLNEYWLLVTNWIYALFFCHLCNPIHFYSTPATVQANSTFLRCSLSLF